MNVNFLALGKIKESYFREACEEYRKRMSAFANVKIFEYEPAFIPQDANETLICRALEKEAEKLRAGAKGTKVALCVEGERLSSEMLAKKLKNLTEVSFIIGSSYGLDENFKRECDFRLSMSEMTFPHTLARVMLFEQVYRALSINANRKYHK